MELGLWDLCRSLASSTLTRWIGDWSQPAAAYPSDPVGPGSCLPRDHERYRLDADGIRGFPPDVPAFLDGALTRSAHLRVSAPNKRRAVSLIEEEIVIIGPLCRELSRCGASPQFFIQFFKILYAAQFDLNLAQDYRYKIKMAYGSTVLVRRAVIIKKLLSLLYLPRTYKNYSEAPLYYDTLHPAINSSSFSHINQNNVAAIVLWS